MENMVLLLMIAQKDILSRYGHLQRIFKSLHFTVINFADLMIKKAFLCRLVFKSTIKTVFILTHRERKINSRRQDSCFFRSDVLQLIKRCGE